MGFVSIIWKKFADRELLLACPDFFKDLSLDSLLQHMMKINGKFDLAPLFYTRCNDKEDIIYRQEVFRDLDNERILLGAKNFIASIETVKGYLAGIDQLYDLQREGWYLEACIVYADAIVSLQNTLAEANPKSEGFTALEEYLVEYTGSESFRKMRREAKEIKEALSRIRYNLSIGSGRIVVMTDSGRDEYNEIITRAFEKFHVKNEATVSKDFNNSMSHVEAGVLKLISKLFPQEFDALLKFYTSYGDFIDKTVDRFYMEIQFYISFLKLIEPMRKTGLNFCIPELSYNGEIYCRDTFDISLALELRKEGGSIVTNEIYLHENERIIVVTGPNNGGKTTFARTFGQVHYLASLGLPVPGIEAKLLLFDNIYTVFEEIEDPEKLMGKLEEEMDRIHSFINRLTPRSIIILNEMLSSTSLADGKDIAFRLLDFIRNAGSYCVYVTFIDAVARLPYVVSMVSQIDPDNPARRTFKILRMDPDGMAYATAIARKYGLTKTRILERIA